MATIRIRNMMFYGFHGIYEYEREQGQKFFVDVSLETRDNHAAETDSADDGVDSAHTVAPTATAAWKAAFPSRRCPSLDDFAILFMGLYSYSK